MKNNKEILENIIPKLLDPQARDLAEHISWWSLKDSPMFSSNINPDNSNESLYPIAIIGKGPPIMLLHGFDSSFLEFRRLVPFLSKRFQLFIPDLFGFGFCPRPMNAEFSKKTIISHK